MVSSHSRIDEFIMKTGSVVFCAALIRKSVDSLVSAGLVEEFSRDYDEISCGETESDQKLWKKF